MNGRGGPGDADKSQANADFSDICRDRYFLPTDSSGAESSGEVKISGATAAAPAEPHLAGSVFSPNRVARIINLCVTFPADRRRHAGGFSA